MNRIDQKFKDLKAQNKKAFIAFVTAGDPNLKTTIELVLAFEKAGVDIIELGVPFSDPLADGPTIQASYERALAKGVNLPQILDTVRSIRKYSQIPIALMSSYNPIFHFDESKFVQAAYEAGVDGLVIPDLPPEEAKILIRKSRQVKMATIFFIAPTTTPQRIEKIGQAATGFIYYVSITGVTGERTALPEDLIANIKRAKSKVKQPVCVGFGISTPQQVKAVSAVADGVIVGSAIVKVIEKYKNHSQPVYEVAKWISKLTNART